MEVKTIAELRNLVIKALGPWQGEFFLCNVREGLQGRRVELDYYGDDDLTGEEGVWRLCINDGFIVETIKLGKKRDFSAANRATRRILRKKGYVLFNK